MNESTIRAALAQGKSFSRYDEDFISLAYANLTGANLSNVDLAYANLRYANLSNANLIGATLTDAHLWSANLTGANLTDADLDHANLRRANLTDANLSNVDLRHANLTEANLTDANLWFANLWRANLRHANLFEANLLDANLTEAILTEAKSIASVIGVGRHKRMIFAYIREGEVHIQISCRDATADVCREAIRIEYKDDAQGKAAYLAAIDYLESTLSADLK